MKYIIRLYNIIQKEETLMKTYEFDYLPYIPRKGEHILCQDSCNMSNDFVVVNVCSSFDDYLENNNKSEVWIEIVVKEDELGKEWWE